MKVQDRYADLPKESILKLAARAVNNSMRESGLVSSPNVLGVVFRSSFLSIHHLTQTKRMKALSLAHKKVNAFVAEGRIRTILERNFSSSVDKRYQAGDDVLVCQESSKQENETQIVSEVEGKQINVKNEYNSETKYSSLKTMPFIWDPIVRSELFARKLIPFKSNTLKETAFEIYT